LEEDDVERLAVGNAFTVVVLLGRGSCFGFLPVAAGAGTRRAVVGLASVHTCYVYVLVCCFMPRRAYVSLESAQVPQVGFRSSNPSCIEASYSTRAGKASH